jgi:hypothetical protein
MGVDTWQHEAMRRWLETGLPVPGMFAPQRERFPVARTVRWRMRPKRRGRPPLNAHTIMRQVGKLACRLGLPAILTPEMLHRKKKSHA